MNWKEIGIAFAVTVVAVIGGIYVYESFIKKGDKDDSKASKDVPAAK